MFRWDSQVQRLRDTHNNSYFQYGPYLFYAEIPTFPSHRVWYQSLEEVVTPIKPQRDGLFYALQDLIESMCLRLHQLNLRHGASTELQIDLDRDVMRALFVPIRLSKGKLVTH